MIYARDDIDFKIIRNLKEKNKRERPFVYFSEKTCKPEDEEEFFHSGSYPSGHSAAAWTTALVLSELFPEKSYEIIKHGYEVGQGRVICGYHWQSDVNNARLIVSACLPVLHSDKKFKKYLKDAKKEKKRLYNKKNNDHIYK